MPEPSPRSDGDFEFPVDSDRIPDTAMIDLKKKQPAAQERPRREYSLPARLFFSAFDLLAGKRTTLRKLHALEMLAGVPYRAWENRQYGHLVRFHGDERRRRRALLLIAWSRAAQDNEYRHLLVLEEVIRAEREKRAWYHRPAIMRPLLCLYRVFSWGLALISLPSALAFNAEFEDHAERVYARFVADHPQWESLPADGPAAREYGAPASRADLFRRIALDERGHRDSSIRFREMARGGSVPDDMPPGPQDNGGPA
jgi:ubiquinol oxidase